MMKGMSIQLPIHRIAPHTSTFLCVNSFLPFLKFLRKVKHWLNLNIQGFHKSFKIPLIEKDLIISIFLLEYLSEYWLSIQIVFHSLLVCLYLVCLYNCVQPEWGINILFKNPFLKSQPTHFYYLHRNGALKEKLNTKLNCMYRIESNRGHKIWVKDISKRKIKQFIWILLSKPFFYQNTQC